VQALPSNGRRKADDDAAGNRRYRLSTQRILSRPGPSPTNTTSVTSLGMLDRVRTPIHASYYAREAAFTSKPVRYSMAARTNPLDRTASPPLTERLTVTRPANGVVRRTVERREPFFLGQAFVAYHLERQLRRGQP